VNDHAGKAPRLPVALFAARHEPERLDVRFALWRSHGGGSGEDDLLAALALLPAARAEADQIEAALLFAARAEGLSWVRISQAMGLGSPQAARQRFGRVTGRARHRGSR
jgi:hypothetical protein